MRGGFMAAAIDPSDAARLRDDGGLRRGGVFRMAFPGGCVWDGEGWDNVNGEDEMAREAFTSDRIGPPAGPFSQAVRGGETIYLSGQVGRDPATGRLADGGVAA